MNLMRIGPASWYLNKGRPTWWHLLYYVNLLLSMFRMLIHPSSGACDYLVRYCVGCIVLTWGVLVLCSGIGIRVQAEPLVVQPELGYHITNSQSSHITPTRLKSAQYSLHNKAPSSCKLLKMDVLTSETFWAVNWHNKTSVIKLIYLYSNDFYEIWYFSIPRKSVEKVLYFSQLMHTHYFKC